MEKDFGMLPGDIILGILDDGIVVQNENEKSRVFLNSGERKKEELAGFEKDFAGNVPWNYEMQTALFFGYGFMLGDVIREGYKDAVVIDTRGVIQVVHPENATRFIIDLDDSKKYGHRISSDMSYEEQCQQAKKYIDWLLETREEKKEDKQGRAF